MYATDFIIPNIIQTRVGTVSVTMTITALDKEYANKLRDDVYDTLYRFTKLTKNLVDITSDDVRHDRNEKV